MSQLFLFMRLPKQLGQIFQLVDQLYDDASYPVGMPVDECRATPGMLQAFTNSFSARIHLLSSVGMAVMSCLMKCE